MPQIDVYIFRFFPFFIFFIFLLVYLYVYFVMLPTIVGVLKFRIKYNLNLYNDLIKLKGAYLRLNYFVIQLFSDLCKNFNIINKGLINIYNKQYLGREEIKNTNIIKLFRL